MDEVAKCPHIEETIQPNQAEEQFKLLLVHVKPKWNVNDVVFERSAMDLSKGVVNTMIKCYNQNNTQDAIMIRIYNPKISEIFDRKIEVKCIKYLSQKGCAPQMLMTFNNGYCYKFFHGEILNHRKLFEKPIWCGVARALAKIHSSRVEDVKIKKKALIDSFIHALFDSYPSEFLDDENDNKILKDHLPPKEVLQKELENLLVVCQQLNSPLTLCHHDVRAENILWNATEGLAMFVDFENMNCDYQAVDIAAHMIRMSGVNPPDFTLAPSDEFRIDWIKVYLEEYYKSSGRNPDDITERDVQIMFVQVSKFYLLLLLADVIGSVVFHTYKLHESRVDLMTNAKLTIDEYYRVKDHIWNLQMPR